MYVASRAPRVLKAADEVLKRIGILDNPYLQSLADGSMPLEAFRRSQEQFFFAVTFFPRPMAALVGRIPDPRAPRHPAQPGRGAWRVPGTILPPHHLPAILAHSRQRAGEAGRCPLVAGGARIQQRLDS